MTLVNKLRPKASCHPHQKCKPNNNNNNKPNNNNNNNKGNSNK